MTDSPPGRMEPLAELLARLASGDLSARGSLTGDDDEVDAVLLGINMLAEDLEVSRDDLEGNVRLRTYEFERLNANILQLNEMGNMLQACESVQEAYEVIRHGLGVMFGGLAGALYLYNPSRNLLHRRASWGNLVGPETISREDCWALRRGQPHRISAKSPQTAAPGLVCAHYRSHDQGAVDSICVLLSAHGETTGLLHLVGDAPPPPSSGAAVNHAALTPAMQQLGNAVSEQMALSLANLELRETLRLQALRDALTGLYNRRFVEDWIQREINRADHSQQSLGVIMADLDHFKSVNDIYGHDAGDALLKAAAEAIRTSLRAGDIPCRFGGEEFLILVVDVDAEVLARRAENVRASVSKARVDHGGQPLPAVTLSAGLALYPEHGPTAAAVVKAADEALYAAKAAGRDRQVFAGAPQVGRADAQP